MNYQLLSTPWRHDDASFSDDPSGFSVLFLPQLLHDTVTLPPRPALPAHVDPVGDPLKGPGSFLSFLFPLLFFFAIPQGVIS